jgi:hypothetical protein
VLRRQRPTRCLRLIARPLAQAAGHSAAMTRRPNGSRTLLVRRSGYLLTVHYAKPPPNGVVTCAEAADILGVSPKRVTKMRSAGLLRPATEVETAKSCRNTVASRSPTGPGGHHCRSGCWRPSGRGPFVDTDGAADPQVEPQWEGRLGRSGPVAVAAHGPHWWSADAGVPPGADRGHRSGASGDEQSVRP